MSILSSIKHIYNYFTFDIITEFTMERELNRRQYASSNGKVLLLGDLVCSIGPKHSSWTGVRPLLEQRPGCCGICTRLCFVALGQAT